MIRVELAGTQVQWIEEENEEEMEALSFIPSAGSEPRWHMCDNKYRKELQVPAACGHFDRWRTSARDKPVQDVSQCVRRLWRGEREVTASKWREMV